MFLNPGTLYWITGLSGAGKTTIGKALYEYLKQRKPNVVFLDGDELRDVFGRVYGHTIEERKNLARSYSNLCRMLTQQGIDVVCSTMSLFREVHEMNRATIQSYYEIFIECDMHELVRRDQKGLYSKALKGELCDVIGVNTPYDRPGECDLIIDNTTPNYLQAKVKEIVDLSMRR